MSWKAQNGAWVWIEDGSGDPNTPPAGPPPKTLPAATTAAATTAIANNAPTTLIEAPAAPAGGGPAPLTGAGQFAVVTEAPNSGVNLTPNGVDANGNPLPDPTSPPLSTQQLTNLAAGRDANDNGTVTGTGTPSSGSAAPAGLFDHPTPASKGQQIAYLQEYNAWAVDHPGASQEERQAQQDALAAKYPEANSGLVAGKLYGGNTEVLSGIIANTTEADKMALAAAGGNAQAALTAGARNDQDIGTLLYNQAGAAAAGARGVGNAALAQTTQQGAAAESDAARQAAMLASLAAGDTAQAGAARATSAGQMASTAGSLADASQMVAMLQRLAATGDPAATSQLAAFRGNAGTAGALQAFDATADATGDIAQFRGTGGAGAAELERIARGEDIGPSAAEALLRKASDQEFAQNIALARSGRGAGESASAMRQALFANAAGQQQLGNDLAALRANEATTARGQNIGAATAAAGTSTTVSGQRLAALQSAQQGELVATQQKLESLVNAGQMTQQQADQQLNALIATQQGQLTAESQRIQAATAAGSTALTSAATSADLAKTFATLGLNYDVNAGAVTNQAGQLVMTGDQIAAALTGTGLGAQAAAGQTAATLTGQGTQAFTQLLAQSDAMKTAAATVGLDAASKVAALSQSELAQLSQLIQNGNGLDVQKYLGDRGISVAAASADMQAMAAIIGAVATGTVGVAGLVGNAVAKSDVRAKTDIRARGAFGKHAETFDEFLGRGGDFREAKGYSYRYKDPKAYGAAPGRQFGPMAQDIQRTAAKGAVVKMPDGMLGIDPRETVLPLMVAAGETQHRMDRIEDVVAMLIRIAEGG